MTFHKERLLKQENTRGECRKAFYCNFILKVKKKMNAEVTPCFYVLLRPV